MFKYIYIVLTILLTANLLQAQLPLFDKVWRIEESYADLGAYKVSFYHKDSTENSFDYSNLELIFQPDGTYTGKGLDSVSHPGTWILSKDKDSIAIDDQPYKLMLLNDEKIITRGYRMQLKDTLGNLDTVYTYLVMYPFSLITGKSYSKIAENFEVYPNPAADNFTVDFGDYSEQVGELKIVSVYGEISSVIQIGNQRKISINTSAMPDGFYFIEIMDKSGRLIGSRKLRKQDLR